MLHTLNQNVMSSLVFLCLLISGIEEDVRACTGGLHVLVVEVGSNLSALERAESRDARCVDRSAHYKAIATLTGLSRFIPRTDIWEVYCKHWKCLNWLEFCGKVGI